MNHDYGAIIQRVIAEPKLTQISPMLSSGSFIILCFPLSLHWTLS